MKCKCEEMKAFINALLEEFSKCGDIDGGTFQCLAEKHGILEKEIRHKPCGVFCTCADTAYQKDWQEGIECFRVANWLSAVDLASDQEDTSYQEVKEFFEYLKDNHIDMDKSA